MTSADWTPLRFEGEVAVITGAGRGIGREHALAFARRGAAVVVNDSGARPDGTGGDDQVMTELVRAIEAEGGRAVAHCGSIADAASWDEIVTLALDRFGRIDIIVNNAGNQLRQAIEAVDEAMFRRHIDIHLMGTFGLSQAAWPHLARTRGRIVNTLSALLFGMAGYAAYAAAKGGIFALSRTLAVEGRVQGVRVNCIVPGAATRLMTDMPGIEAAMAATLRRDYPPAIVAQLAACLAHASCNVTGEAIAIVGRRLSRYILAESRAIILPDGSAEGIMAALPGCLADENFHPWRDTEESVRQ